MPRLTPTLIRWLRDRRLLKAVLEASGEALRCVLRSVSRQL